MAQLSQFDILETIGVGSFGRVQKIKRKEDGKILVWKEMCYKTMEEREKQQLVSEVNILRDLKHANIVRYYDRVIDKQNQLLYIIMEHCEGGDLKQFLKELKKNKECIPESSIWKIFMQIVLALHEIHRRKQGKVLHRDIKPANIFLDAKHNVKLGDFGLSKKLSQESQYAYTNVGTPYYMSPEQINENRYNEKSDIWSVGCLLYELCALQPPFSATNHLALAMKIKNGKFEKIPKKYSNEIWRVINWCLQKNHEHRPNVDDLLNLPEVSLRLREKRLKENQGVLQNREKEAANKDKTLQEREKNIKEKEVQLQKREKLQLEKLAQLQQNQQALKEQLNLINSENNSSESQKYGFNNQSDNQSSEFKPIDGNNNEAIKNSSDLQPQQSGKNLKSFFRELGIPKNNKEDNKNNNNNSQNTMPNYSNIVQNNKNQEDTINPRLSYVSQQDKENTNPYRNNSNNSTKYLNSEININNSYQNSNLQSKKSLNNKNIIQNHIEKQQLQQQISNSNSNKYNYLYEYNNNNNSSINNNMNSFTNNHSNIINNNSISNSYCGQKQNGISSINSLVNNSQLQQNINRKNHFAQSYEFKNIRV